ncbi:F-box/kelch-repeat protein At3g23880-like [Arachis hypogaea]|uniref:F-box/kelch-repeat protein At3g23880-like n=1 Tax=Arachis hypogaea TaxID=3818 RepID=UPI000DECE451|nr:F-box/kelch-repeat protein At3g23880-like [Arachis hypogaea]
MATHSNQIPKDLVWEILAKLSVKSLKRFSCVHKSWLNLLENSDFKSIYYENLKSKTAYSSSLLLWRYFHDERSDPHIYEIEVHLLSGERYENMVTLVLPSLFEEIGFDRIIDCVNGIICHYKEAGLNVKIGLWNPKTDEHKIIPPSIITNDPDFDAQVEIHGFGYDNVNDDYKVIQHICYYHNEFYQYEPALANWQIYSLKSNCWKKLNLEMTEKGGFGEGYVTYLNGVCHWRGGDKNGKEVLVSFNLSTETFQTTLIGWQQSDDIDCLTRTLVVLNDSVALISSFDENSHIEISILGEVGVKESWVKLFTIGPFPYIWHPMIMGNKCDIIFFMGNENHELASFDVISGKIIHNISIKIDRFGTWIYKKNLLSFTTGIN